MCNCNITNTSVKSTFFKNCTNLFKYIQWFLGCSPTDYVHPATSSGDSNELKELDYWENLSELLVINSTFYFYNSSILHLITIKSYFRIKNN